MAAKLESKPTRLHYLGHRDHIYAVDVFAAFEQFAATDLDASSRPAEVRAFKMIREVECDGRWRVDAEVAEPSASVEWKAPDGAHIARFDEDGERITARGPDNPKLVLDLDPTTEFSGTAVLRAPSTTSELLLGLVQANKALHVHSLGELDLPHDEIRMIYVEGLTLLSGPAAENVRAEFRHKGRRRMQDRTYTLAEIRCAGHAGVTRLCFSC